MATAVTAFGTVLRPSISNHNSSYCSSRSMMTLVMQSMSTGTLPEFRGLSVVKYPPDRAVEKRDNSCGGVLQHWEMIFDAFRIQKSNFRRIGFSGRGGGAFGSQMNLFSRFSRLIKSYANAILSIFEDPEKILEQAVIEMKDDLMKIRQATAQVLASQKLLENKYKSAQQATDDWYKRAQLALRKGEDDLAREALKRRKSYVDNATSLKSQLDQQKTVVDNLVSNSRLLESKIYEAMSKKDNLMARAKSAKTATKVSEMLGNVKTSSALSAFEKMEEKVMVLESQAEALNIVTTDDLEGKFALLESMPVDDDFMKLKKELSGSSSKGELSAGRARIEERPFPYRDMEIEKELNELRRKSKEY